MAPLDWLRARDPDLAALRRAARAAIVMPDTCGRVCPRAGARYGHFSSPRQVPTR